MPVTQPIGATTPPLIRSASVRLSQEERACVRAVRRLGNLRSEAKDELARIQLLCVCRGSDDMRRLVKYDMKAAWHDDQQARIADPHHPAGTIVRKAREGWQSTVRRYARDHGLECKVEVRAIDNNRRGDYDLYFFPKDDPFLKWVAAGERFGAGEAELIAMCRKKGVDPETPGNAQIDVAPQNVAVIEKDLAIEKVVAEDVVEMQQDASLQVPSLRKAASESPQEDAKPASVAQDPPVDDIMVAAVKATEDAMPDAVDAGGHRKCDLLAQLLVLPSACNAATAKSKPVKSPRNAEHAVRSCVATDATGHVTSPEPAPPSRSRWHSKQRHIVLDVPPGMTAFAAPWVAQLPPGYWDRHGSPARPAPD